MKKNLVPTLIAGVVAILLLTGSCEKLNDNINKEENKSSWSMLGSPFENMIYDIIAGADGRIYSSGGDLWNISVYDGTAWSRLGDQSASPFTGGLYWPIATDLNDNVYAVGRINIPMAGGEYHVAKWEKSSNTWINLTAGKPLFNNGIQSFITDVSGNLYAAGNLLSNVWGEAGDYIYKWNGSSWSMMGSRLISGGNIRLHFDNAGNLYGSVGYNDNGSACVSKWNGTAWEELGGTNSCNFGTGQIYCLNSDSKGNVYAGGYYTDGIKAYNIYKWTKTTNEWSPIYTFGSSLAANSIAFDTADTLYVAGTFTNEKNMHYIAKFHIVNWSDYGNLNANNTINSICFDKSGNMYAGGSFTNKDNKYYVAVCKKRNI
jgi:hypothetical protein